MTINDRFVISRKLSRLAATAAVGAVVCLAAPQVTADSQQSVEYRIFCQDDDLKFLCRPEKSAKGHVILKPYWFGIFKLMQTIGFIEAPSGTVEIDAASLRHRYLKVPMAVPNSPSDDGKPNLTTGEKLTGFWIELKPGWKLVASSTGHHCGDLDDEALPYEASIDSVNNRLTCGRFLGHPGIDPGEGIGTITTKNERPGGTVYPCVDNVWFEYTYEDGSGVSHSHEEQARQEDMPPDGPSWGKKYWSGYRADCPASLPESGS